MIACCFVLLEEHGVLPDFSGDQDGEEGFRSMTQFALNSTQPIPEYSKATWENLAKWTQKFMAMNTELTLPGKYFKLF